MILNVISRRNREQGERDKYCWSSLMSNVRDIYNVYIKLQYEVNTPYLLDKQTMNKVQMNDITCCAL